MQTPFSFGVKMVEDWQTLAQLPGIKVLRLLRYGDCPYPNQDYKLEAQRWMSLHMPVWTQVHADYYELNNECSIPTEWFAKFTLEAMKIFDASMPWGRLIIGSWFPGQPDISYLWPAWVDTLTYAAQHDHIVGMHAYGIVPTVGVSQSGYWLAGRPQWVCDYARDNGYLFPDIFITEAGYGDGGTPADLQAIAQDFVDYDQLVQTQPCVKGYFWWTISAQDGSRWSNHNIDPKLTWVAQHLSP